MTLPSPTFSSPQHSPINQWHHHLTFAQAKYKYVNLDFHPFPPTLPPQLNPSASPLNSIFRKIPNLTVSLPLCFLHSNPVFSVLYLGVIGGLPASSPNPFPVTPRMATRVSFSKHKMEHVAPEHRTLQCCTIALRIKCYLLNMAIEASVTVLLLVPLALSALAT